MKILLCAIRSNPYFFAQPLGLSYVASYLLRDGHRVRIEDGLSFRNLSRKQFTRWIDDFKPDAVGFTTYTHTIEGCFILAKWAKELNPAIKVIFGGPHATCVPSETLANEFVDFVVVGEGEETMVELAGALEKKASPEGIRGVSYKDGAHAIKDNGPRALIRDLNSAPLPAYELLDMRKYYPSLQFKVSGKPGYCNVLTSRGCPHGCSFCSHRKFGKEVRFRSPENVVDELEMLTQKYHVGQVTFVDDAFLLDAQRATEICRILSKRRLNLTWGCLSRVDYASADLYEAMGRAGCRAVFLGAESGSQELLDQMKKGITIKQTENAVALAKKYLGRVNCGFILGFPGDTREKIEETVAFAKRLDPDNVTFTIFTPLPGSEIFERLVSSGKIDTKTVAWDKFSKFPPALPALELTVMKQKELYSLARKAFIDYYVRPAAIWGSLRNIKSMADICQYARATWEIFLQ